MSTVVLSRLFRLAAGVIVAILTARLLGPAGRGEYFIVVTLAAVVAQLGNLGLHSSNTYLVARNPQLLASLVGNSLWVSILGGGAIAVVVLTGAFLFDLFGGLANSGLWFVLLLAPLGLFFMLGENLLLGLRRTMLFNLVEIASSGLLVLLHVVSGLVLPSAGGFLAARTAAMFISSAGVFGLLVHGLRLRLGFAAETLAAGLGYSARAYLVALVGYLVLRANVFLLQSHSGFAELGLYSVAAQIADALEVIPTSVALVLFPQLLHQADNGWVMMKKALIQVALIMLLVCVTVGLTSDVLISVAFGTEFHRSSSILRLLLPQVFFISVTSIVSQFLAAKGMPLALLGVWTLGLVTTVVLGSALIPRLQGEGAAVALSISYFVIFALAATLALIHRPRKAVGES